MEKRKASANAEWKEEGQLESQWRMGGRQRGRGTSKVKRPRDGDDFGALEGSGMHAWLFLG